MAPGRAGGKVHYVFETLQQLIEAPAEEPEKRRYGFPTAHRATTEGS